jgi:hypothetical protein
MKQWLVAGFAAIVGLNALLGLWLWLQSTYAQRFDQSMQQSTNVLQLRLDPSVSTVWAQWVYDLVFRVLQRIVIPLVIAIGILTVIIGMYQVMTSTNWDDTTKWVNYVIRWVVGILVMFSWQFIGAILFQDIFQWWRMSSFSWVQTAQIVYERIIFPFLKLAIYLSLGVLFLVLLTKTLQYITNTSETIQKQAINIIVFTIAGMLLIFWSKTIVETIYGTQQQVLNNRASNIGEIWAGALNDKNIEFFYQVINRVLWLTTFIILVLIIVQVFQMLINPNDEALFTKIKNTFLYVFIGVLVIGAGYLIANFFIIT